MDPRRSSWVGVVGPTASGKSQLAVWLARSLEAEIVNCDALQVYQGMDIGTAKADPSERASVPHHLIDVTTPDLEFSAAEFARRAARVIDDISSRGRIAIVVGGTGLYLRALREGLFEGPGRSKAVRSRLDSIAEKYGERSLFRILRCWDPESAERIHPNDRVRVVRALEVTMQSKRPMSQLMLERKPPLPGFRSILVGLNPRREDLLRRIDYRVERMFAEGFVDEVRHLVDRWGYNAPAFKAIGYGEVVGALRDQISLDEAMRRCQLETRRYAKRQLTWFSREEGIRWFVGFGDDPAVQVDVRKHCQEALTQPLTGV